MPPLTGRNILCSTYATANVDAPFVEVDDCTLKYCSTFPTSTPLCGVCVCVCGVCVCVCVCIIYGVCVSYLSTTM